LSVESVTCTTSTTTNTTTNTISSVSASLLLPSVRVGFSTRNHSCHCPNSTILSYTIRVSASSGLAGPAVPGLDAGGEYGPQSLFRSAGAEIHTHTYLPVLFRILCSRSDSDPLATETAQAEQRETGRQRVSPCLQIHRLPVYSRTS
jgi:hypothetical protein